MKTVYITEEAKKILKESILKDTLPNDIISAIENNKTSLRNNPIIPDAFDYDFIDRITNKEFEKAKETLKQIGHIDSKYDNMEQALSELIKKCQEIEKPIRPQLEKICYNLIVELFEIPEDAISIKLDLVDKVNTDKNYINVSCNEDDDIEYEDLIDIDKIKNEIHKRRALDALIMGAALRVSSDIDSYAYEFNEIAPQLPELYKQIIALNTYLLFTKDDIGISDKDKKQMGVVNVSFGNIDEIVKIEAEGMILPVLFSEAIRGFMELFISHGLPEDKSRALAILGKTDYLKAEPWDMRIGPKLWDLTLSAMNIDGDFSELPYIMMYIAKLSTKNFNTLMREVLANTKKGKKYMNMVVNKAKEQIDYNGFEKKMTKIKDNKGIITDEYMHLDEF